MVLQNSSDFYRWLAELETARSSQTEEKFRRYGAELQGHLHTCNELLARVGSGRTQWEPVPLQWWYTVGVGWGFLWLRALVGRHRHVIRRRGEVEVEVFAAQVAVGLEGCR